MAKAEISYFNCFCWVTSPLWLPSHYPTWNETVKAPVASEKEEGSPVSSFALLDCWCSPEVNKQFGGKHESSADPNMSICFPWNSLIHQRFPSVCSICSLQLQFYFLHSSDLIFGHKKVLFKQIILIQEDCLLSWVCSKEILIPSKIS